MSTRLLPLLAFVVWCFICQRWYVCHIKQRCGESVEINNLTEQPKIAESQPKPTPIQEEAQTAEPSPEPAAQKPVESSTKTTADLAEAASHDEATVVELDDHTVIFFPYNKLDKEPNANVDDYLDRLAETLKTSGGRVIIEGHTDNIGDAETNKIFSERRAKNIRDILKKKGVAAKQIETLGWGEAKPLGSNDNPQGRRQNRRVELFLKK